MARPERLIRLSRSGACRECGQGVPAGAHAWWRPGQPLVTCTACRPAPAVPDPGAAPSNHRPSDVDIGVAGGSAMGEFQRRHDVREARIRQRRGRLSGLVLALASDPSTTRAWERGSVGESKLAAVLGRIERDDVVALHDRHAPGARWNIDHIVIAPSGVYVVDAKRYTGEVRVRDVAGVFSRPDRRLFVGGHDRSASARQMGWQINAVRTALGPRQDLAVVPVLCFVDAEWPLFTPPREFEGVRLEEPRSLRRLVTERGTLTLEEVVEIAVVLSHALRAFTSSAGAPPPDAPAPE